MGPPSGPPSSGPSSAQDSPLESPPKHQEASTLSSVLLTSSLSSLLPKPPSPPPKLQLRIPLLPLETSYTSLHLLEPNKQPPEPKELLPNPTSYFTSLPSTTVTLSLDKDLPPHHGLLGMKVQDATLTTPEGNTLNVIAITKLPIDGQAFQTLKRGWNIITPITQAVCADKQPASQQARQPAFLPNRIFIHSHSNKKVR